MIDLTNINEIRPLLEAHGFRFSRSMGQNFLIAAWVPERIAEESGVTKEDGVLEIGPGIGTLTVKLAERAQKVLALELDESLKPIHKKTLSGYDNIEVLFTDAVKANLPSLCKDRLSGLKHKVCANLPYNVTTPLITAFLNCKDIESITVMIQKEVAERICAPAGCGEYGSFTVLCQWYCSAKKLFDVPPSCFIPQPKVTSTVIKLTRRDNALCDVEDERFFFKVVRAAFNQRRKALPNAVASGVNELTKDDVREALLSLSLPETVRGEQLTIEQFAALSNILFSLIKAKSL